MRITKYAKDKFKNFIEAQKEPFEILSDELNEVRKIDGDYKEYTVESRLVAIKIIEKWMRECFNRAYEEENLPPAEEENLYRSLDKGNRSGRDDDPYI